MTTGPPVDWCVLLRAVPLGYCSAVSPNTTRPAAASRRAQQHRFDVFRHTYNHVRPHEALDQRRPVTLYEPSDRPCAGCLTPITYPEHFEIRRVSTNGGIRWNRRWVNVSHISPSCRSASSCSRRAPGTSSFGPMHLGWLDEHDYRIHDHRGRLTRRRKLSPIN